MSTTPSNSGKRSAYFDSCTTGKAAKAKIKESMTQCYLTVCHCAPLEKPERMSEFPQLKLMGRTAWARFRHLVADERSPDPALPAVPRLG